MELERRIVLFGPPLCGKRTLTKAFADSRPARLERATLACGSEKMPHEVSRVPLPEARVEIVTIGGAVWSVDAWWPFLADSSAVVLVLDSQAGREAADREHIAALATAPSCPRVGCVVWTKEDLVTTHGLERVKLSLHSEPDTQSLWRGTPGQQTSCPDIATWPTFSTRFDDQGSMLTPLTFLMSQLERS